MISAVEYRMRAIKLSSKTVLFKTNNMSVLRLLKCEPHYHGEQLSGGQALLLDSLSEARNHP